MEAKQAIEVLERSITFLQPCELRGAMEAGIRALKCGIERPWADEYQRPQSRKYYRKCGVCGERYEQSEMIRTNRSPNGWVCFDCHNAEHPEYDIE